VGRSRQLDFFGRAFYFAADMATPTFGDAEFFFGRCQRCGKRVLTYTDVGPDDRELRRCLHCESIIATGLEAATAAELHANGYGIIDARTCGDGGGCTASGCGMLKR